jgi:hypothetical protein
MSVLLLWLSTIEAFFRGLPIGFCYAMLGTTPFRSELPVLNPTPDCLSAAVEFGG